MELIRKPNSKFLKVKCTECEEEMIVFNHAKTKITCHGKNCNETIVEPSGGKAIIYGEIIEQLTD